MLAIAAVYRRATLMRAVVCQQRQAAPAEAALGASRTRHFERAASLRRSCSCTIQIVGTGKGLAMLERERREDQAKQAGDPADREGP